MPHPYGKMTNIQPHFLHWLISCKIGRVHRRPSKKETQRHNRCKTCRVSEISSGRRPLDDPLHVKSVLAFKLSLFLDKIPTNTPHEGFTSFSTPPRHTNLTKQRCQMSSYPHVRIDHLPHTKKDQNEPSYDDADKLQHYDLMSFTPTRFGFNRSPFTGPERRDYWPISSDGSSLEFKEFENSKQFRFSNWT